MSARYTRRQGQYLAYIAAYTRRHGRPPSEAEMAAHFAVSAPSAHQMVDALARRGLIARTAGQARSIRVLLPPESLPALETGRLGPAEAPAFAATYPHLARWIMSSGWVELGRTDWARSLARALDEGGLVWEGKDRYGSVEELLRDLNAGIAQWLAENARRDALSSGTDHTERHRATTRLKAASAARMSGTWAQQPSPSPCILNIG
jgi:repressor LexA